MDAFTLLVVEDDDATRTFLADNLSADGFTLLVADCVRDGIRLIEQKFPDLVLVDIGLPDASGLDLISHVREADRAAGRVDTATPLLVVSGRTAELDRLRGFDRGADDYVLKPFSYSELLARVHALLRRTQGRRASGRWRVGGLVVDTTGRAAYLHGTRIPLSQKEFALLRMLGTEPYRVFTKLELLRAIWGHERLGTTRTLDSHACRLRNKLQDHSHSGEAWIVNVWGVGYRLTDTTTATTAADGAPPTPAAAADRLGPGSGEGLVAGGAMPAISADRVGPGDGHGPLAGGAMPATNVDRSGSAAAAEVA
jgi:DNA-binding response OmpR family regulator